MSGLLHGHITFVKICPACRMYYRYQEFADGVYNFDDKFLIALDMCIFIRENVKNHVAVGTLCEILEQYLHITLKQNTVVNAYLHFVALTEHNFADNIALLANNRVDLQRMTNNLHDVASKVGLRISQEKTKTIQVRSSAQNVAPLCIDNHPVEEVESFAYLGSVITSDGGADVDVKVRIGKAAAIFRQMGRIWNTSSIDQLYNTIVLPTALYASETWKKTAVISKRLDVFHQRCLRKILKISYLDHVTNENVLNMARSHRLQDIVTEKRMRLARHILHLPTHRIAKTALMWTPAGGKRGRSRPKCTWRCTFKEDLTSVRQQWHNAERLAANRDQWRIMSAQCASLRGKD